MSTPRSIELDVIEADPARHPRAQLNESAVDDYARLLQEGNGLPPVVVYRDSERPSKLHLVDGWHRLEAARRIGHTEISAEVRSGSSRDAVLASVAANAEHGVRRTNADKRRAVELLLEDSEWKEWSVNRIAEACRVSWDLANAVCKAHLPEPEDSDGRLVERGGTTFKQKKGKRSRKPQSTPVSCIGSMLESAREARLLMSADANGTNPAVGEELEQIAGRLQRVLGTATGASRLVGDLAKPLNVLTRARSDGVHRTKEFEKKKLATHAVNVGLGCGHSCVYCSSPSLRRMHEEFQALGQSAYTAHDLGFAIIDPKTPERVAGNIPGDLTAGDVIQLSTLDDAWSPEARKYNVGAKTLEVLLAQTPAQVRILTKSHHVGEVFGLAKKHADRVIIGLSTGTPASREDVAAAIEPNASTVRERLSALAKAHKAGLRTFGMLCPIFPGIGDSRESLEELFDAVLACGVEDIWLEPVNARGKALPQTADALRLAGLDQEADCVDHIRKKEHWSVFTTRLIDTSIKIARDKGCIDSLHVLLYPSALRAEDEAALRKHEKGIVWLGNQD